MPESITTLRTAAAAIRQACTAVYQSDPYLGNTVDVAVERLESFGFARCKVAAAVAELLEVEADAKDEIAESTPPCSAAGILASQIIDGARCDS